MASILSDRGRDLICNVDLIEQALAHGLQDPYHQHHNPQGFVNLGVAENKLCLDLMQERLTRPDMGSLDVNLLGYNPIAGIKRLREEAARFLSDYCHSPAPLNPDNIIIMNGCSSVLCALAAVICDAGDAFLTPTPYYPRIVFYTAAYPGLQPAPVPLSSKVTEEDGRPFQLTVQHLEDGLQKAQRQGLRVKAILLINPHNPLGEVYSAELLKDCLEFAHRYSLHVIIEEVYMLSVMDTAFTSVLSLDNLPDPERTHFVWGINKDFGLGGYRVSVLHTRNKEVVQSASRLAFFHQCAAQTQFMISRMLQDRDWLDNVFLPTNKKRLREAQEMMVSGLQDMGIAVHSRSTGIYVWADLSKFLTSQTFEAETELWEQFMEEKLCITPGKTFHCGQPGWFRITTSLPEDVLKVGLQRLKKVLQGRKTSKKETS